MADLTLEPRGPFHLASAVRFIAGWPPANRPAGLPSPDGGLRLGFLADDWSGHAGVVLRQDREDGPVHARLADGDAGDLDRVRAQAARIVSLDHDGSGYAELGARDEVVGRLQRASGWLRPVLFHSPYEAACWAVISARLRQPQAARLRDALSSEHGARLDVDGESLLGFPAPDRLLAVVEAPGLPDEKLRRLHGIARAALEGRLDREELLAADAADARAVLLGLRGIGPFWADAILLRAVGTLDVLPLGEPRMRERAAEHYGRPDVVDDDEALLALAERWRPYRTWVGVLLRAAG